jgi:hypothetical protein
VPDGDPRDGFRLNPRSAVIGADLPLLPTCIRSACQRRWLGIAGLPSARAVSAIRRRPVSDAPRASTAAVPYAWLRNVTTGRQASRVCTRFGSRWVPMRRSASEAHCANPSRAVRSSSARPSESMSSTRVQTDPPYSVFRGDMPRSKPYPLDRTRERILAEGCRRLCLSGSASGEFNGAHKKTHLRL